MDENLNVAIEGGSTGSDIIYKVPESELKGVADHIRSKSGTTAELEWPIGYENAIDAISTGPDDPHTLLLLHGDKIEDASMYRVPLTNNGVSVSSNQGKFGGKSLYFDGNSWINFPERYAAYRDEDFTIDWWEYCTTSDANHQSRYFSTDAGGPYNTLGLLLGHLGKQVYCGNEWSMINGAEMFNIVQNQWVHWATVRSGNTLYTFKNGVKFAQTSVVGSIPYDEKTLHCIGGWRYSTGQKWIGYLSEFRISNVARWTSDFTPPDKPYNNVAESIDVVPLDVIENGTYTAGVGTAYSPVTVLCPSPKPEQTYNKTYTANGNYSITPDMGKVISGGNIIVKTPAPKPEQEKTLTITSNGDYPITPDVGKVLSKAIAKVNVPAPTGVEKTVEITANGLQEFPADPGTLMSKLIANVNVSGGGGGFDPSPYTSVEVYSYTPASNTSDYSFENPETVMAALILTKPMLTPPSTFGFSISSAAILPGGNTNVSDEVWKVASKVGSGPNGKMTDYISNYGSFNRTSGVMYGFNNGYLFKGGVTYVFIVARGNF